MELSARANRRRNDDVNYSRKLNLLEKHTSDKNTFLDSELQNILDKRQNLWRSKKKYFVHKNPMKSNVSFPVYFPQIQLQNFFCVFVNFSSRSIYLSICLGKKSLLSSRFMDFFHSLQIIFEFEEIYIGVQMLYFFVTLCLSGTE